MARVATLLIYASLLSLWANAVFCQEQNQQLNTQEPKQETLVQLQEEPKYVGEFFDLKVSQQNYFFVKSALTVFGNRGVPLPEAPEEKEKVIWGELLLSYEAFRRGITVEQQEVDEEIRKMLESGKAAFDWKKDKDSYEKWVKEKTSEPAELFENQIRHILQIQKLNKQVMAGITPAISEKEAYQEFLNEHSTLGVELVEFASENEARKFYLEVKKNPKAWDEERTKRPADFKRPGSVSLEFLIDIWKFTRAAAYKMMYLRPGSIYPPAPIYEGFAVFKVLDKRPADKGQYKKLKNSYYEQIRGRKRYEWLGKWFENLKRQANIKIYDTAKKEERGNE